VNTAVIVDQTELGVTTADPEPQAKRSAPAKPLPSKTWTQTQFLILPPLKAVLPDAFRNVETDTTRHDNLLAGVQRLRGSVYLQEGAIRPEDLTADGRHEVDVDQHSWHVLSLDRAGQVTSCLRYLDERRAARFDNLWIRKAALALCPQQGGRFRIAVEREMGRARQMHMGFGEVGGWAVAESHRRTLEPVGILLATYGLLELLGGCLGVATATFRHSSAMILRKIGLTSLLAEGEELKPYFDPAYGCQMEVLRFDSRFPGAKYAGWVAELSNILRDAAVICRSGMTATLGGAWKPLGIPGMERSLEAALLQASAA
jgi:hypothetical protein